MMMYDDFIRRVHKHRTNPNLSMQIQKCVDYIEMNLDKKDRSGRSCRAGGLHGILPHPQIQRKKPV